MNEFEDQWNRPSFGGEEKTPPILGFIMKASGGLVKTKEQAIKVALAIVIVAIVAVPYLLLRGNDDTQEPVKSYESFPQFLPENGPNR